PAPAADNPSPGQQAGPPAQAAPPRIAAHIAPPPLSARARLPQGAISLKRPASRASDVASLRCSNPCPTLTHLRALRNGAIGLPSGEPLPPGQPKIFHAQKFCRGEFRDFFELKSSRRVVSVVSSRPIYCARG